jgi:AraC-like DNA-binding protein
MPIEAKVEQLPKRKDFGMRMKWAEEPDHLSIKASETVHAPLLLLFPELVTQCGIDPRGLYRQARIGANAADMRQITYRQASELLELAAASLGRSDFGMMLANLQCRLGIEGPLGQVMRHARCFGDVLELAVRHGYAHSLASNSWLRPIRSGRWILFGHDILLEGVTSPRQIMEQILLIGHQLAIRLTGGRVAARRILLRHQRMSPPAVYRRHFGCDVRFGQRVNATVYRVEDLACPILSADALAFRQELVEIKERFAEKHLPLNRGVRGMISPVLDDVACTAEQVAHRLGVHPRTLHRRLQCEGTSFRRIRDELRRDLARYYLCDTDLDLKAIAERLGFSEQSALSRRAQAWFGCAPSVLRAGVKAGANAACA